MKKMNAAAKFGAGAIGALALTFGATGVVGAEDADAETTDPAVAEEYSDEDHAARHEARRAQRLERRSDVADIIGITSDDLSAARQDGQSLAEIAGDAIDEVVDYFVDAVTNRVDAAVEEGRITEEMASERLDRIEERIEERVESTERSSRRGHRGHHGGDAPATETVDS